MMSMIAGATLGRQERIKSRKLIDELFTGGNSSSMAAFPLRVVYATADRSAVADESAAAQMMVSVSKRHFKRAVKRNRVKRQVREAYRLKKQILLPVLEQHPETVVRLAFIWQADELYSTAAVVRCMQKLLQRVAEKLSV